ncbi:HNH endonuclease signature motif containing protein [Bacillus cereus group sp. N21]|uniref:HNH endonuclease signature motif containing protein n=1 Tax=Bacillus cereus group sp. N21 TaxID=2794591 RepID=UPI0018F4A36B|nr:HNH endonuclease signature motif containing protein [Bacillus cereus group sp. N21]MBJ8027871.1 HNH endonuclease [Bacillus cereus group sp. N21]
MSKQMRWTRELIVERIKYWHSQGESLTRANMRKVDSKLERICRADKGYFKGWTDAVTTSVGSYVNHKIKPTPWRIEDDKRIYTVTKRDGTKIEFTFSVDFPIIETAVTSKTKGYPQVRINDRVKNLHKLALEWKLGRPIRDGYVVDHVNRDKTLNTWDNLREVSVAGNSANKECKGASLSRGSWQTHISKGSFKHSKTFPTESQAIEYYRRCHLKLHGRLSPYSDGRAGRCFIDTSH